MKTALILNWPTGDDEAEGTVRRIRERLVADNIPVAVESDGLCVAADSDMVRRVAPNTHSVGDLFSGGGPARDWPQPTGTSEDATVPPSIADTMRAPRTNMRAAVWQLTATTLATSWRMLWSGFLRRGVTREVCGCVDGAV